MPLPKLSSPHGSTNGSPHGSTSGSTSGTVRTASNLSLASDPGTTSLLGSLSQYSGTLPALPVVHRPVSRSMPNLGFKPKAVPRSVVRAAREEVLLQLGMELGLITARGDPLRGASSTEPATLDTALSMVSELDAAVAQISADSAAAAGGMDHPGEPAKEQHVPPRGARQKQAAQAHSAPLSPLARASGGQRVEEEPGAAPEPEVTDNRRQARSLRSTISPESLQTAATAAAAATAGGPGGPCPESPLSKSNAAAAGVVAAKGPRLGPGSGSGDHAAIRGISLRVLMTMASELQHNAAEAGSSSSSSSGAKGAPGSRSLGPSSSTAEVVAERVVPLLAQHQGQQQRWEASCLLDVVPERFVGPATSCVLHAEGGSFSALVEALAGYLAGAMRRSPDEEYIWIDFACLPQQPDGRPQQELARRREAVKSCERVLLVLDEGCEALCSAMCLWQLTQVLGAGQAERLVLLPAAWYWPAAVPQGTVIDVDTALGQLSSRAPALAKAVRTDLARCGPNLASELREALLAAARREAGRADRGASANPRWAACAQQALGLMLALRARWSETEECLRNVLRALTRLASLPGQQKPALVLEREEQEVHTLYQLAWVLKERAALTEADRTLSELQKRCNVEHSDLATAAHKAEMKDLMLAGLMIEAEMMVERGQHTRAEMACHRIHKQYQALYGKGHMRTVAAQLLLARVTNTSKLYDEAEEHALAALLALAGPGSFRNGTTSSKAAAHGPGADSPAHVSQGSGEPTHLNPNRCKYYELVPPLIKHQGVRKLARLDSLWQLQAHHQQGGGGSSASGSQQPAQPANHPGSEAPNRSNHSNQHPGSPNRLSNHDPNRHNQRGEGLGPPHMQGHAMPSLQISDMGDVVLEPWLAGLPRNRRVQGAACLVVAAESAMQLRRYDESWELLAASSALLRDVAGPGTPTMLATRSALATLALASGRPQEAVPLVEEVAGGYLRTHGQEHHTYLKEMARLSDVHRTMGNSSAAADVEKKILGIAGPVLAHPRLTNTRSLLLLSSFLLEREHLLNRAGQLLPKAYLACQEKLGAEHEQTQAIHQTLKHLAITTARAANTRLNAHIESQSESSPHGHTGSHFHGSSGASRSEEQVEDGIIQQAEVLFRHSFFIHKLIDPLTPPLAVAQGLASALTAQHKYSEAQAVLASVGLARKNTKEAIPPSYLRWLNVRVANYLDMRNTWASATSDIQA